MARGADPDDAYVFDLVEDDADGEAPPGRPGAGPEEEPDGPGRDPDEPPAGAAGARLRALAPVAAVLAVLLGTGFAVDGARDGARMERMRDLQGGVVDLSAPLGRTWEWEGAVGPVTSVGEGWETEVAVLGGLLAFQSADDLVALDPATGEEAWRLGLGADADCGPVGPAGWDEAVTRSVVCLTGSGAEREAVVVGPDGVASAPRALDAADTARYGVPRPGPDGTVLRAERVGPAATADGGDAEDAGDARCNDRGECTGTVETGRDLLVRAEDARTGAERWSVTVPFRPTPADQCATWYSSSWDGSSNQVNLDDMLDADGFGAQVTGELVRLYGCGIEAAITPGGVALGTELEPGAGNVESLRTGGYGVYAFDGEGRTTLHDARGDVVGEIEGYVLPPSVRDGAGPETVLAGVRGTRLRAHEPDGRTRWDVAAPRAVHLYLAQVSGTAMFLTADGAVRGVDLATGEERFTWTSVEPGTGSRAEIYVARAFTDGESVLLAVVSGTDGPRLVTLDAVSGAVVWEQGADEATSADALPRPGSGLLTVDGNLLEVTSNRVRGLG